MLDTYSNPPKVKVCRGRNHSSPLMGLPTMASTIHAPSISTTTNGSSVNSDAPITRESLLALMNQRDELEKELKALGSVLDSHKVTMQTALTTFDGFPRDDIDVAQSMFRVCPHPPAHIFSRTHAQPDRT